MSTKRNRNVVFSGRVSTVTRKTRMPRPRKVAAAKIPGIVQDGPWKGATLYMSQLNGTLPMTISGDTGRYVFKIERSEPIDGSRTLRRTIPAGLYWEGAQA